MYKKLTPAVLFCLLTASAYSQVTLTAANFNPVFYDAFVTFNAHPNGISAGASGASQTWNYSSLDTMTIDTAMAVPCSYPVPGPGCSWAIANPAVLPYGIPEVTFGANITNYLAATPDSLCEYGYYYSPSDQAYFSNPIRLLTYPFTYLSSFTDTYAGAVTFTPTGLPTITGNETGSVSVTCDSWGTLVLPGNTYNNVLRVHSTQVFRDEASLFGLDTGVSFQIDNYSWYDTGIHTALLTIAYTAQVGGSLTDTLVSYVSHRFADAVPTVAGIETSARVFPNPASDVINIEFTVAAPENVRVSLVDLLGREVRLISDNTVQGTERLAVPTAGLSSGIYLVRLQSGSAAITRKVELL